MRVGLSCKECHNKAVVASSKKITDLVTHQYCQCTNVKCGHTWRQSVCFDHTITSPAGTNHQLILSLLQNMPQDQVKSIVNQVQASSC